MKHGIYDKTEQWKNRGDIENIGYIYYIALLSP